LTVDRNDAARKTKEVLERCRLSYLSEGYALSYEVKSYENSPDPKEREWIDILFSELDLTFDKFTQMLKELELVLGVNSPRKAFLSATRFEGRLLVGFPLRDVQGIQDRFHYIA
jgi:hypothetical protein